MVITLVGNKKDLDHKRSVSTEEGEAFARKHGLVFLEASAKTGECVEEAFISTSAKVLEQVNNGVFNLQDEVSLNFLLYSHSILMLFLYYSYDTYSLILTRFFSFYFLIYLT